MAKESYNIKELADALHMEAEDFVKYKPFLRKLNLELREGVYSPNSLMAMRSIMMLEQRGIEGRHSHYIKTGKKLVEVDPKSDDNGLIVDGYVGVRQGGFDTIFHILSIDTSYPGTLLYRAEEIGSFDIPSGTALRYVEPKEGPARGIEEDIDVILGEIRASFGDLKSAKGDDEFVLE